MHRINRSSATALVACALVSLIACGKEGETPVSPTPLPAPTSPVPAPNPPAPGPQRTVSGVVQTVDGIPMLGAAITPALGGGVYRTDAAGAFSFPYPASSAPTTPSYLTAVAPGFETRVIGWGLGDDDVALRPFALFARLDMPSDGQRSATLRPDDPSWFVGEEYESDACRPCQRIHLDADRPDRVRLTLSWTGSQPLRLWASNGSQVVAAESSPDTTTAEVSTNVFLNTTLVHVGLKYDYRDAPLKQPIEYRLTSTPIR